MSGGRSSKKHGVKCRCKKKVKKVVKVPQRGPGVAELEKILGHQQPSDKMYPFYASFIFRQQPSRSLKMMRCEEQRQEANSDTNYGLSFTQMMTMDDEHPLFHLSMKSVCPANPGLESTTENLYTNNIEEKNRCIDRTRLDWSNNGESTSYLEHGLDLELKL